MSEKEHTHEHAHEHEHASCCCGHDHDHEHGEHKHEGAEYCISCGAPIGEGVHYMPSLFLFRQAAELLLK